MATLQWAEWKCDFCENTKTTDGSAPSAWMKVGQNNRDICEGHDAMSWGEIMARMP